MAEIPSDFSRGSVNVNPSMTESQWQQLSFFSLQAWVESMQADTVVDFETLCFAHLCAAVLMVSSCDAVIPCSVRYLMTNNVK